MKYDHLVLTSGFRERGLKKSLIKKLCLLAAVGAVFSGSGPAADAQETVGASSINMGDLVSVDSLAGSEMPDSDRVPASLLQLSSQFSSVLWIELESGVLHLLHRQGNDHTWRPVLSRPVSIGKAGSGKQLEGDNKTPVGIYSVYEFIGDEKLIDFYGVGAFPLSYPNAWDRLLRRTGSGIWLHGLPKSVVNRPRLDSEGCVVIDNKTLEWMKRHIEPEHTRVVLGRKMRWASVAKNQLLRTSLNQRFKDWLRVWSALDTDAYLNFYHPDFTNGKKDFAQWARYKRAINRSKQWAKVSAQDVNFFMYPGESELLAMEYRQSYSSNNFRHTGYKVLFWRRGANDEWQIIYEGSGRL